MWLSQLHFSSFFSRQWLVLQVLDVHAKDGIWANGASNAHLPSSLHQAICSNVRLPLAADQIRRLVWWFLSATMDALRLHVFWTPFVPPHRAL